MKQRVLFFTTSLFLTLSACKHAPRDIRLLSNESSPSHQLVDSIFKTLIESGYEDKVLLVKTKDAAEAAQLLSSGKADIALSFSLTMDKEKVADLGPVGEESAEVKAMNKDFEDKNPDIADFVKNFYFSKRAQRRGLLKTLEKMEEKNLTDFSVAAYYAIDTIHSDWETWITGDDIRNRIKQNLIHEIKKLEGLGVRLN